LKKEEPILSIFFHNYYGDDQKWVSFLLNQINLPFYLFYNSVTGSFPRIDNGSDLQNLFNLSLPDRAQLIIRSSTNKGKDIGGKLVLMDAYLKLNINSDYILLLHDKHSPYHSNSFQWSEDLLSIAKKAYQGKVLDIFQNNARVGIVASANSIKNEWDNEQNRNAYTDSIFIKKLKEEYHIHPDSLQYVAGTMFWVRAFLFKDFFSQYNPLLIRSQLEEGNVTDVEQPTKSHAWERLFSWIVISQGYQIRGV
jgi:lipopolysaccharide biosynthesis protein